MRGTLFAAVAAVVSLAGAQAQSPVILNESKIQAVLKDDATVVSLPVESTRLLHKPELGQDRATQVRPAHHS